jgi:hypothetical protein
MVEIVEWKCPRCNQSHEGTVYECSCGYIFGKELKITQERGTDSRFKNREEYEAWKAERVKETQEKRKSLGNEESNINHYYEILELKPNATKEEIKQAYKDLLTVWNPDKFTNEPTLQQKAREKVKKIDEAYEKLIIYFLKFSEQHSQSELKKDNNPKESHFYNQPSYTYKAQRKKKSGSFLSWLLWWRLDQDELDKQIAEYQSLKITQSARGRSLLLLIFSSAITIVMVMFFSWSSWAFIGVFMLLTLGFFIYKGHKWAMMGTMLLWSLEKIYAISEGLQNHSATHSSSTKLLIHLIVWAIYMHALYLALKVEMLRNKDI